MCSTKTKFANSAHVLGYIIETTQRLSLFNQKIAANNFSTYHIIEIP